MPKEVVFHGDLPLESGLAARSMPRVFGRGSRSQAAALVSDRDDAALFPAIRILERYGSAKSGGARRVRTACRRIMVGPGTDRSLGSTKYPEDHRANIKVSRLVTREEWHGHVLDWRARTS